jgi:hypothetical protein
MDNLSLTRLARPLIPSPDSLMLFILDGALGMVVVSGTVIAECALN